MKHTIFSIYTLLIALLTIALSGCATAQNNAPAVQISKDGKALQQINISSEASDATKELAHTLANYLHKISGGDFAINNTAKVLSATSAGISLGIAADFPNLSTKFNPNDSTKTEDYLLQTHQNGIAIVGATDLGLNHAVWDFLYRLGYRQFFPGETWEIIPSKQNLTFSESTFEHPDYYSRKIWPGFGNLKENAPAFAAWSVRNRLGAGIELRTGHSYGAIIHRHKEEFEKHPEYLTKPGGSKFCVSNPGLQKLVIDDALAQFEKNPALQSVSMDPSDGGGWESDSCPDAKTYENITDRAVTLANLVAEAVNKKYPGKYVGMYAYNEHSPAPTIKVHPNVIPSIATSFIRGGFTLEQLLDDWNKQAQHLGIREYYSVNTWDRDKPGAARGANIAYLKRTIPHFYDKGARFLTAESSDNFGSNGLGYYIASRLMWHVADAEKIDAIKADFYEKAFGAAKKPMAQFYDLIDGSNKPLFSEDLIGRMYRQLDAALKLTNDSAVRARIDDLALYTRYTELFSIYSQANGAERQAAFEDLMKFTWRIRSTQMVHTLALWRDLAHRDKSVKFPEGSSYNSKKNDPWKSDEQFTAQQIQQFISEGIKNNPLRDFEIKTFSDELVSASVLNLAVPTKRPARAKFGYLRGNNDLIIKLDGPITIKVKAGTIYTDRGNSKLSLHRYGEEIADNNDADAPIAPDALQTFETPPDKEWHEHTLKAPKAGLYVLHFSDASMGTEVDWPESVPAAFASTLEKMWTFRVRSAGYFYVPKGTKSVGGFATGGYRIYAPDGKVLLSDQNGYFNVPVPEGQDGRLWEFGNASGSVALLTVPSYFAHSPQELLLPKEIVETDK